VTLTKSDVTELLDAIRAGGDSRARSRAAPPPRTPHEPPARNRSRRGAARPLATAAGPRSRAGPVQGVAAGEGLGSSADLHRPSWAALPRRRRTGRHPVQYQAVEGVSWLEVRPVADAVERDPAVGALVVPVLQRRLRGRGVVGAEEGQRRHQDLGQRERPLASGPVERPVVLHRGVEYTRSRKRGPHRRQVVTRVVVG
jgi:hypothetical protein